ncbi:hypothetical protein CIY_12330 [Butyrivibrio fibrisolvens 16/4]|nr:hypothetical protein CIY_12330 [Butyrivibrio fibrisolvens 16/4]
MYEIYIKPMSSNEEKVTITEPLTLPNANAALFVQIDTELSKTVTFKTASETVNFNQSSCLYNIKIDNTKDKQISMNLYNNFVAMGEVEFIDGIKNVTGKGVNTGSIFYIIGNPLVINGSIDKVGTLELQASDVSVKGNINIGTLKIAQGASTLTGTAKLSFAKLKDELNKKVLTAVTSNITIANDIVSTGSTPASIKLEYSEKVAGVLTYYPVPVANSDEIYVDSCVNSSTPSYAILNAPKANIKSTTKDLFKYVSGENTINTFVKYGGKIYWNTGMLATTPGYTLYTWNGTDEATKSDAGTYGKYADVIKEIDTRKSSTTHYIIQPNTETDSKVRVAEKYTLPAKKNAASVLIKGADQVTMKYKAGTTFTLNNDVKINKVDFVPEDGTSPLAISLGDSKLTLLNTTFSKNISSVKGAKLTGGSELSVAYTGDTRGTLIVNGAIDKVNTLALNRADITADTINIDCLRNIDDNTANSSSLITCNATPSFVDKAKTNLKSVTSKLTIVSTIDNLDVDPVNIDLRYNNTSILDETYDFANAVDKSTFAYQFMKSTKVKNDGHSFIYSNRTKSVAADELIKSKGIFYYNTGALKAVPGYDLYVDENSTEKRLHDSLPLLM